jgi:hypothetical protein
MTPAVERLTSLQESADCFDIDPALLLHLQVEAVDERLRQLRGRIPLLHSLARARAVDRVRSRADVVPLLFPDDAYRSYADSWIADGAWQELAEWLRTVSAHPVDGADLRGVGSLEDFVERLARVGCYVSCSSGATGRSALIAGSRRDLSFASRSVVRGVSWATGIAPAGDRRLISLDPRTSLPRNETSRLAVLDAFCAPGSAYEMPVPPIGISAITQRAATERRHADGTAEPAELTALDAAAIERWATTEDAIAAASEELIAASDDSLLLGGTFTALFAAAARVRGRGLSAKDFRRDNAIITGGLRDTTLPDDYREFILDTFNVSPARICVHYAMHELNTLFPQCAARRYHVAPWVMVLPLNGSADRLIDAEGEIECRAAFFDLSISGRWGGIVSGDLVGVEFGACACGRRGVTIGEDIVRYANLLDGDADTYP